MKKIIYFSFILALNVTLGTYTLKVYGQTNVAEVTLEVPRREGESRQELFDKAIEQASYQYIEEIIGAQRLEQNKEQIKTKVVQHADRYVLSIRQAPLEAQGADTAAIILRISLQNLQAILLEEGLLYKMDGPPRILPMVSVVDRVNSQGFSWWSSPRTEASFLTEQIELLHQVMRAEMRGKGFFVLDPIQGQYGGQVPEVYRTENMPSQDYLFFGDLFKSQIVLRGQLAISPVAERSDVYRLEIKLTALHSNNGRVIGEVVRSYQTDRGNFQNVVRNKLQEVTQTVAGDLSVQVMEAWRSGTFGANLLQLSVRGDLNPKQVEDFKAKAVRSISEIQTIKERLFEPGRIVFEIESSNHIGQVAEAFRRRRLDAFRIQVTDVGTNSLELQIEGQP